VRLLAVCQAAWMTALSILITAGALIGQALATNKGLAPLPLAIQHLVATLTTIPAAFLLAKLGQRVAFALGAAVGALGAVAGMAAIWFADFRIFCAATALLGVTNGFAGFFRLAAADAAGESGRARAISIVMAGGVVAAVFGPELAAWSRGALVQPFLGSLALVATLQLSIALFSAFMSRRALPNEERAGGRPLRRIMAQPSFVVALVNGALGYGGMILLMTATPLAMAACSHSFYDTAHVIQWHVLGMFAPAFVTGHLISRFGVTPVIMAGAITSMVGISLNLRGTDTTHFAYALLLIGIGWNLTFVSSTTLLSQTYTPAERARTQAAHDFVVFGCVALASLLSGQIQHVLGWRAVNLTGLLLGAAMLFVTLCYASRLRYSRERSGPDPAWDEPAN